MWREILIVLAGVGLLLLYAYAVQNRFWVKPERKQRAAEPKAVVPSANQISLLMTHYGFDLDGAKVMWKWIRSGKADNESLVLDIFAQKVYRQDYLSLGQREARQFYWDKPNAFKLETLRFDPRLSLERPEIENFIKEVQSV